VPIEQITAKATAEALLLKNMRVLLPWLLLFVQQAESWPGEERIRTSKNGSNEVLPNVVTVPGIEHVSRQTGYRNNTKGKGLRGTDDTPNMNNRRMRHPFSA
jgi:hypothetical protein